MVLYNSVATGFNALNKKLDDLQISADAIFSSVDALAPAGTNDTTETNAQYGGRKRSKTTRRKRKV